jgi:hypothetical protein
MKAAEFVGRLFLARDVTHSAHLNTRSYARHKALESFYESIIGLADAFAEAYQGRHGLIGPIALQGIKRQGNVVDFLEAQLADIEEARYEVCDRSDSSIQQLIDDIVELYLKTLYQLKFLS